MLLVAFTGCLGFGDNQDANEENIEDDAENSQDGNTTALNNTDDTNNDETPEVYDGPLKILALR